MALTYDNNSNFKFTGGILIFLSILSLINCFVERENGVIVLNNRNFEVELENHEMLIIEFYSTECKHCKEFAPKFEELTVKLASLNPPIFTAKVEAEINKDIAKKFGITAVPKVFIFKKGYGIIPYNDKLEVNQMFNNIEFQNSNTNEEISFNQIDDLITSTSQGFILLGNHTQNLQIYNIRSKTFFDANFYHCPSKECLDRFQAKDGQVIMFKNKGEEIIKFDKEKLTPLEFTHFIIKNSMDLVEDVNEINLSLAFQYRNPALLLLINDDYGSYQYSQFKKMMYNSLRKHKGKIQGIIAKKGFELEARVCTFLNLFPEDYPQLFIVDDFAREQKYRFTDLHTRLSTKNITDFVNKWSNGELKTFTRSTPPPPFQPKNFKIAVRDTFQELVLDSKKDIVLFVLSSLDETSKKVAEVIEKEVITKLKITESSNPDLEFVMVDFVKNEIEFLKNNLQAIPSLILLKGNDKNKIVFFQAKYTGEEICDFITNNAHFTVEREDL